MKKLLLILLCLPMIGFGQKFGINCGLSVSDISPIFFDTHYKSYINGVLQGEVDLDEYNFIFNGEPRERIGFSFGGFYEISLPHFELETELRYYRKGYEYLYSLSDYEFINTNRQKLS